MPRTEDIERFTEVLNSLGDEPAIRAARSETIEQVAAPGKQHHAGIGRARFARYRKRRRGNRLPGGGRKPPGHFPEPLRASRGGRRRVRGAEAGGAPSPGQGPGAAGEGLDFASLFGEEPAPEGIEISGGTSRRTSTRWRPCPMTWGWQRNPRLRRQPLLPRTPRHSRISARFQRTPRGRVRTARYRDLGEDFTSAGFETPQQDESAGTESFELPALDDVSFSEPAEDSSPKPPLRHLRSLVRRSPSLVRRTDAIAGRTLGGDGVRRGAGTRRGVVRSPVVRGGGAGRSLRGSRNRRCPGRVPLGAARNSRGSGPGSIHGRGRGHGVPRRGKSRRPQPRRVQPPGIRGAVRDARRDRRRAAAAPTARSAGAGAGKTPTGGARAPTPAPRTVRGARFPARARSSSRRNSSRS